MARPLAAHTRSHGCWPETGRLVSPLDSRPQCSLQSPLLYPVAKSKAVLLLAVGLAELLSIQQREGGGLGAEILSSVMPAGWEENGNRHRDRRAPEGPS